MALGGVVSFGGNSFLQLDTGFWLDELACEGHEADILQCPHNDWGVNDCANGEYATVICEST